MRRCCAALAVVIGCGSPAAVTPVSPPPVVVFHDPPAPFPLVEPPAVDLERSEVQVDPLDEQWPIIGLPSVEPHAAIAAMYGTTAPWPALCAARRDPRRIDREEALQYLTAWCELRDGREQAGRARLATLVAWLAAHEVTDPSIVDRLVGIYVATGRHAEAIAVETGRKPPSYEPAADTCHRLFREYMLVDGPRLLAILHALQQRMTDRTCFRLAEQITCPLALGRWGRTKCRTFACAGFAITVELTRCSTFLHARPELWPPAYLAGAVAHWPRDERSVSGWLGFAAIAARAQGEPLANETVLAALTNAMTALVVWR